MRVHHAETREFRRIVQRSEQRRTVIMLAVLVAIAALVIVRSVAGGRAMAMSAAVESGSALLILIVTELALLAAVRRALRTGHILPTWVSVVATIFESLIPTVGILALQLNSPMGAYEASTPPALLSYGIILVLSIMRLRPRLCMLAGSISAIGQCVVMWLALDHARETNEPVSVPLLFSYPVMVFLTGVGAAFVTREVASWVNAALEEAAELQRIQMVARNTLIFGLAKLAEYRDSDTGAHLDRISVYSTLLAQELRSVHPIIDADWIQRLGLASSMHDIGKVGVPDAVLLKPGKLTPEERKEIEKHPGLGFRALDAIIRKQGADSLLQMSAEIASCHHERWDGKGYPAGVMGDAIPLAARIVSVADVYDALTSARVYKPPMSHAEARRLLREGSGTQFDPAIVAAFERIEAEFDAARARHADRGVPHAALSAPVSA